MIPITECSIPVEHCDVQVKGDTIDLASGQWQRTNLGGMNSTETAGLEQVWKHAQNRVQEAFGRADRRNITTTVRLKSAWFAVETLEELQAMLMRAIDPPATVEVVPPDSQRLILAAIDAAQVAAKMYPTDYEAAARYAAGLIAAEPTHLA